MRIPIRKTFAALLWILASVPVVLWFVHRASPMAALDLYRVTLAASTTALFWGSLGIIGAILVYPPAIPFLRLRVVAAWRRLGTDRSPMHESLARMHHLETHDDRLKVGRTALQLGETALALENLSRAFELDPSHQTGRYQFALALLDTGNLGQATAILQGLVDEDEKHAFGDALFQLGRTLYRQRRDEAAIRALRRYLELFPGGRQAQLLLAHALADAGEFEAAHEQLRAAKRRPEADYHLTPAEALARARARVTILRQRGGDQRGGDPRGGDA